MIVIWIFFKIWVLKERRGGAGRNRPMEYLVLAHTQTLHPIGLRRKC